MPTSAPEVKAERPNVVLLQPWVRIEAPQQDEIQPYLQAEDSAVVRSTAPHTRCCAAATLPAVSVRRRVWQRNVMALAQVAILLKYTGHHIPSQVMIEADSASLQRCAMCMVCVSADRLGSARTIRRGTRNRHSKVIKRGGTRAFLRLLPRCFA